MFRYRISGDNRTVTLLRWLTDEQAIRLLHSHEMLHRARGMFKELVELKLEKEIFDNSGMTTSSEELDRVNVSEND